MSAPITIQIPATLRSECGGLPSDFGFPMVVHPHDPDTIYVVPLDPATRTCPDNKPAVWRSDNGGDKWKRLSKGLPKKQSFFTVLRDAMTIDELKSPLCKQREFPDLAVVPVHNRPSRHRVAQPTCGWVPQAQDASSSVCELANNNRWMFGPA
jgi:hypothetical protein